MSFIGTVGVVAQQGNNATVSAPTSVSIATSSSGNYDDAFTHQMLLVAVLMLWMLPVLVGVTDYNQYIQM